MKYTSVGVLLGTLGWVVACGGSDDESKQADGDGDGDELEPALVVAPISFDLDHDRPLSSLTDEEIRGACDEMAAVFHAADAGVACQIVAASEATTEACESTRDVCLMEPDDALQQTTVRSAPAPVDCSIFDAQLTAACDFPVSLLEDCVNALSQSVVPSAQAAHCEKAPEIEDVAEAHGLAVDGLNADYASICFDLLQCEDLVGALLEGESPMGAGGAGDE